MDNGQDTEDTVIVGIEASGTITAAMTVDQLTRLLQGLGATPATLNALAQDGQASATGLEGVGSSAVALERRRRA